MIWMLPVAGALAGAMLNKKRPLQGAMMGGLLGAGGAYAAPALMGAGGAGAAGSYGAGAYGTAAGYGGAGAATTVPGAAAASPGLLGTMGAYAKPAMQALQAAQMTKGLLGSEQSAPMQVPQNNSAQGAQIMAELYKSGMPGMTPEQQMRMQRRKTMWG